MMQTVKPIQCEPFASHITKTSEETRLLKENVSNKTVTYYNLALLPIVAPKILGWGKDHLILTEKQ